MVDHEHLNEYILKIVLILLNLLMSLIAQFFYILKGNTKQYAIASLVILLMIVAFFILFSLFVIFGTIIYRKRLFSKRSKTDFITIVVAHVLTSLAGVSYLLGNKIGAVFAAYGQYFDCNDECREILVEISNTLIILSILILRLTPPFVNKTKVLTIHMITNIGGSTETPWSPWKITAQSMALLLEFDAWFTAVSDIPVKATIHCPSHDLYLAWILLIISLIIWAVLLVVIALPGVIKAFRRKKNRYKAVILCIILALIWVSSGGYILADNVQPLGCMFDCQTDLQYLNSTTECHYYSFHATRAAILAVVMIYLSSVTVILIVHWCLKHGKNILDFGKGNNGHPTLNQMNPSSENDEQDQISVNQEKVNKTDETDKPIDIDLEEQSDDKT